MGSRLPPTKPHGHLFDDLPLYMRVSGSPADARNAFNILTHNQADAFIKLCLTAQQKPAPEPEPQPGPMRAFLHHHLPRLFPAAAPQDTEQNVQRAHQNRLYTHASEANFERIAAELVRNWGTDANPAETKLRGLVRDRHWPAVNLMEPSPLHIRLIKEKPDVVIPGINLTLLKREYIEIRDADYQLVFSTNYMCGFFRPGPWMGALITQYACLNRWRQDCGDEMKPLPKPVTPLNPQMKLKLET